MKGMLLGYFGPAPKNGEPAKPTHVIVVNLDSKAKTATTLVGPENLAVFDAMNKRWSAVGGHRVVLTLPPGGGKLVRIEMPRADSDSHGYNKSENPYDNLHKFVVRNLDDGNCGLGETLVRPPYKP
jgi:hypothetical protein